MAVPTTGPATASGGSWFNVPFNIVNNITTMFGISFKQQAAKALSYGNTLFQTTVGLLDTFKSQFGHMCNDIASIARPFQSTHGTVFGGIAGTDATAAILGAGTEK